MHGFGQYVYKNGDWCKGQFAHDKMNGRGEFYFANGNTYVGEFSNDDMHGQGVFTWKHSNERYEGNFVQNKPGAKGKLTFSDESAFEGDFVNGKPHGTGTYIYPEKCGGGRVKIAYENGIRQPLEVNKLLQQVARLNAELSALTSKSNSNTLSLSREQQAVHRVTPSSPVTRSKGVKDEPKTLSPNLANSFCSREEKSIGIESMEL